jgi:hypothetical protein
MKQSKSEPLVKTKSILVRFTEEEMEFIKSNAKKIDLPLSQYLRAKALWFKFRPRGAVVHPGEKSTYRKSGPRKGEPYYYKTIYTGIVQEHSIQTAQKLEDEYQKKIGNW